MIRQLTDTKRPFAIVIRNGIQPTGLNGGVRADPPDRSHYRVRRLRCRVHAPTARLWEEAHCRRCASLLERTSGTSVSAALALSATTLVLLTIANVLPIYRVGLLGASRETHVFSGVSVLWREGWPELAIPVLLFAIAVPLVRFALLTAVLATLRGGNRPVWLGPTFRIAHALAAWAMPEAMLLGLWVAYGRLAALFALDIGIGGYSWASAAIAAMATRASLDPRVVWSAIGPDREEAVPTLSCTACGLAASIDDLGLPCPCCGATLYQRKPDSVARTAALTVAGLIFYVPANLLPMAATIQVGAFLPYTVLKGVRDLATANLWGLAILVFCASFAIPLMKLAGMAWLLRSIPTGSTRHLQTKTRLFEIIHEIGRWSMVYIFAIAVFLPLMQFAEISGARAMPGAAAFVMVVIVTMLATETFDPRLLWDACDRTCR